MAACPSVCWQLWRRKQQEAVAQFTLMVIPVSLLALGAAVANLRQDPVYHQLCFMGFLFSCTCDYFG